MKECAAFRDLDFWIRPEAEPGVERRQRAWLQPLLDMFGLPEQRLRSSPMEGVEPREFRLRPLEIPLPVAPGRALVLQASVLDGDMSVEEWDLTLREEGEEDARLGCIDCHGLPYCLRLDEALRLADAAARRPEWRDSPAPFLLLAPFIGVTTLADAKRLIEARFAALQRLGVIPEAPLRLEGRDDAHAGLMEQLGVIAERYRCGAVALTASAQGGLSWIRNAQGEWELVAHKAWEALSHSAPDGWPVPCHTMRTRDAFRNFPATRADLDAKGQEQPDAHEDHPAFPFARFEALMTELG